MTLPKRFSLTFHVITLSLVLGTGTIFAHYIPSMQPEMAPAPQKAISSQPAPLATPSAATNESGKVLGFPDGIPVVGSIVNAVESIYEALAECGGNIFCYMAGGVEVVQRRALDQISGCGNIDTPKGYQNCQTKYQALLTGGSLADVKNPGALFILADIADQGSRMVVPIESKQYIATINPFQSKEVYAQGAVTELNGSGLPKLWLGFRNAAFALSAIVLVIIGFMIMFRSRLDPRTTITAMNSLPKVFFAVILTFFSFALAGLMLDFGRLALQFINQLVPLSGTGILNGLVQLTLVILLSFAAGPVTGGFGTLIAIGLLLLILIIAIMILVVIINILIQMLKRYGQFIVYTVFAPFFFLWGALPGQSMFGWFKSQLSNVLAIPAMFLMVRLAGYIGINSFAITFNPNKLSLPSPLGVGLGTASDAASVAWFLLAPLVSLAILFYATKMPAILDGVLGIKDFGSRAGFGAGAVIGAAAGSVGKINKATGPLSNMTTAAVQKGGLLGKFAAPLHTGLRGMNNQQQSYIPSVKELRTGAVEKQMARGKLNWERADSVNSTAKTWKDEWKRNNILAPGVDADLAADRAWGDVFDDHYNSSGGIAGIAPTRTAHENIGHMNRMIGDYQQKLRDEGALEPDIRAESLNYGKRGLHGPKSWDKKTKTFV